MFKIVNAKTNDYPFFPSKAQKFHYNFSDPAKAIGSEAEVAQALCQVRNEKSLLPKTCNNIAGPCARHTGESSWAFRAATLRFGYLSWGAGRSHWLLPVRPGGFINFFSGAAAT